MRDVYQLPSTPSTTSVVELADGGRRFRKQLVKFGSYINPNDPSKKMVLDKSWGDKIAGNFKRNIIRVPVVEGHPKNSAELLAATRGDLVGVSVEEDGIWGDLDIRAAQTIEGIEKDLVQDVSISYDAGISFDPDYQDKRSGEVLGPMFRHIGLVNDPYITGMAPFQALSDDANVIMLSENKESTMSKVKNEQTFPVEVKFTGEDGKEQTVKVEPGAEVEVPEAVAETVQTQVKEAKAPEPTAEEKAAAEKEAADKAAADKEAADKAEAERLAAEEAAKKPETKESLSDEVKALQIQLSETNAKLATRDAEDAYNTLLKAGKIVPAQKDAFISLSTSSTSTVSLSDGSTKPLSTMLTELLTAGPKRISFSEEGTPEGDGASPFDQLTEGEQEATLKLGLTRETYNKNNSPKKD